MALQSDRDDLLAAWRALSGNPTASGWRTIAISRLGAHRLLAGRHFPGNEEALLVGFASVQTPTAASLPQGRGFLVCSADLAKGADGRVWVALCRQDPGSIDLFLKMAEDVIVTLDRLSDIDDERLLQVFLMRIRAWQEFMRPNADGFLGPEAEVGLVGEIAILHSLILAGIPAAAAVNSWQGPLDGVQDFMLGTGAIEVKSTVSSSGFPALINSLEQLDDSVTRPLFLVGIRLLVDTSGRTLPDAVHELRVLLGRQRDALAAFDSRLLHVGFLDAVAERYTRRFLLSSERVLRVSNDFPRLTRADVPGGVRAARYEIDLDLVTSENRQLVDALRDLGVIQAWN